MKNFITRLLFILLLPLTSYASNVIPTPLDMQSFFNEYSNILNTRDKTKLFNFFNYYIDPNATFTKDTALVDNENPTVEIEHEKFKMNKEQFKKYILDILIPQNQYLYQQNITEVQKVADNIYFVYVQTQEAMTRDYFNKKSGKNETYYVLSSGNWVFTLYYENAVYIIKAATWSEKLNRTLVDKSQVK